MPNKQESNIPKDPLNNGTNRRPPIVYEIDIDSLPKDAVVRDCGVFWGVDDNGQEHRHQYVYIETPTDEKGKYGQDMATSEIIIAESTRLKEAK